MDEPNCHTRSRLMVRSASVPLPSQLGPSTPIAPSSELIMPFFWNSAV